MKKKEFVKAFKEFVKEARKLNQKFWKKMGFRVSVSICISEVESLKDGTLYKLAYEHPLNVDLKALKLRTPLVVACYRKLKRRIDEQELETWVEWDFDLKKWIEGMEAHEKKS